MKAVAVGLKGVFTFLPTRADTAAAVGNRGIEAVNSPAIILFIEKACQDLIRPMLEPDEGSVGFDFQLKHVAPAYPARPIEVEAEVIALKGRRIRYRVEVRQGAQVSMLGEHECAVVPVQRFQAGRAASSAPSLAFWFDVHSPWCCLAANRIGDLARRHGRALHWRPLHLPSLIKAINGRRPLEENAAFLAWYRQDLADWAALQGLRIAYHPGYPLRNSRALRACLHAADQGRAEPFVRRVLRAYWTQGADIADLDLLARLAAEAGLDAEPARAAAQDQAYKDRIAANTSEAIARGVFGVPTVDTGSKLYFGNDRLDLLDQHLARAMIAICQQDEID